MQQLETISKIAPVTSLQPPYSMLRRESENSFSYCEEKHIGIIAYSPLQKGLLTGKFTAEYLKNLDEADHRKRTDSFFKEPLFSLVLEYVDKLKKIANVYRIPLLQLAILWVLRKQQVTAAIMGLRNRKQVDDILSLPQSRQFDSIWDEVDSILNDYYNKVNNIRR